MMRSSKYYGSTKTSRCDRPVLVSVALLLSSMLWASAQAGQWSTYRANPMRSGEIEETVGPALSLHWKYLPVHPPKPAWPMPSEEMPRMHSDNAYHTVVADGVVYWGSSVTNKVYAVDAARGKLLISDKQTVLLQDGKEKPLLAHTPIVIPAKTSFPVSVTRSATSINASVA